MGEERRAVASTPCHLLLLLLLLSLSLSLSLSTQHKHKHSTTHLVFFIDVVFDKVHKPADIDWKWDETHGGNQGVAEGLVQSTCFLLSHLLLLLLTLM